MAVDARNFPQDVVCEPPTAACRSWRQKWDKNFEERWGPALWDDPEDDPRTYLGARSPVKSPPRRRQPFFPPPPHPMGASPAPGSPVAVENDQGLSKKTNELMPRTSP